jgi:hypothetical protein
MLSDKAIRMLAKNLAPRVANEIQCSDRFCELLHELVPDIITSELGTLDEDILFEISLATMDALYLKVGSL